MEPTGLLALVECQGDVVLGRNLKCKCRRDRTVDGAQRWGVDVLHLIVPLPLAFLCTILIQFEASNVIYTQPDMNTSGHIRFKSKQIICRSKLNTRFNHTINKGVGRSVIIYLVNFHFCGTVLQFFLNLAHRFPRRLYNSSLGGVLRIS